MRRWSYVALITIPIADAAAQGPSIGLAAGVAAPLGALAARRTAAPYVAASAVFGSSERRLRLRVDLDAARFSGRTVPGFSGPIDHGDLTVTSVLAHAVVGPRTSAVRPYAMLGMGVHWMAIPGRPNPYGAVWGAGVGAGLEVPIRRAALRVETRAHVILTDYGNSNFESSSFVPVTLGVQF